MHFALNSVICTGTLLTNEFWPKCISIKQQAEICLVHHMRMARVFTKFIRIIVFPKNRSVGDRVFRVSKILLTIYGIG